MPIGSFGALFKHLRITRGQTLRAFCLEHSLDPGNISKLERGRVPPPDADHTLLSYATWLGLAEGTPEHIQFVDRAKAERGRIPNDLLDDEALVEKLPVLFRMIRGAQTNGDGLDELIEKIRRA